MAEALQDLITKNAKNNEIEDIESNDRDVRGEQDDQGSDTNMVRSANSYNSNKKEKVMQGVLASFPGCVGATQRPLQ